MEKSAHLFLETKGELMWFIVRKKWFLSLLMVVSFYLHHTKGWTFFFYFGLLLVAEYIINTITLFKTLKKENRILEIVDKHIEPYHSKWSDLDKNFSDSLFIRNSEFNPKKPDDTLRFEVTEKYDEVHLDLHEQVEYHQNVLSEIEKIRTHVASTCNPVIQKAIDIESDKFFFKVNPMLSKVLSTKFKNGEPVAYHLDYVRANNDFLRKVIYYHEKQFNIVNKGVIGEKNTENELKLLKKTNEADYLENVVLAFEGKTFETDFILFSTRGLYSLEVKNIGGNQKYTIRVTRDGQWLKIFNNGNIEPMQDVTSQMNYHISMTNLLVAQYEKETGKTLPPIEPIYIMGNNDVVIDNQSELNIFRPSYFVHFLRNQEKKVENMDDLKHFMEWLNDYRIAAKKYPIRDYLQQYKKLAEYMLSTTEVYSYFLEIAKNTMEDIKKDPELVSYLKGKNRFNT